jgi:4-coumarate--CoA ligase
MENVSENLSVQKRLYGGVRFTNEIPKNSGGKILRKELKKLL